MLKFNLSPIEKLEHPKARSDLIELHPQLISELTDVKITRPVYPTSQRQESTGSTDMHLRESVHFEEFNELFEDFNIANPQADFPVVMQSS